MNKGRRSIFRDAFQRQREQQSDSDTLEFAEEQSDDSPPRPRHRTSKSKYVEEEEEDSLSDSGTIFSTRESAQRTPEQLQKEEAIRKQALLLELTRMKRDGIKLTREFTDKDPVEVLESEITHRTEMAEEDTMVQVYKAGFQIAVNGVEMVNSIRGKPFLPIEGWAKGLTWNMNMYNRPFRTIHRRSGFRGFGGNPWYELGFTIIGSLVIHMIVFKMTGSKDGARLFTQMFQNGDDTQPQDQGGGGGMMGMLGSLMGGAGGSTSIPSMPTPAPNPSNPFPNQNIPRPAYTMASAPAPSPIPNPTHTPMRSTTIQPATPIASSTTTNPKPMPAPKPIPVSTPKPTSSKTRNTQRRNIAMPGESTQVQKIELPSHAPTSQHPPKLRPILEDESESTLNL